MELDREVGFFESQHSELVKHYENQFVLIRGEELIGSFTTELEAYETGLKKLGNVPFLIKQVKKEARDIDRAPALALGLLNASL